MPVRFDHAVVLVENLESASERFRGAGFDVRNGGTHAGGLTRNALIGFADESYLELLAFTLPGAQRMSRGLRVAGAMGWILRGRTALDRRFVPRAARGEGLIDWAVSTDDLHTPIRRAGSWLAGPFPGERTRPDGVRLAWQLAMPGDGVCPFLIADVTNRSLRVPAASNHPNGASGIEGVRVACADLDRACHRYTLLLGTPPTDRSPPDQVVFVIGDVTVTLYRCAEGEEGPTSITLREWSPRNGAGLPRGIGS